MTKSSILRFACTLVCLSGIAASNPAAADTIGIVLDQAKIMRLPERVATIVIGNPLVADGSLQTGGLLVVTGKGYGTTNLIALDARGTVLAEHTLKVSAPRDGTLTVWRGVERETWACGDSCERTVVLGDSKSHFDAALGQMGSRNGSATGK